MVKQNRYKMIKVQHLRITDSQHRLNFMASCHTKVILKYYRIWTDEYSQNIV